MPCRAELISLPQGAREEDDVVSEDLVQQDAKVRLGRLLSQVGSGQGWGWWHWDNLDLGCKRWVGAKGSTLSQAVPLSPSHKDLLEAGELKWGTDEAQFIYILGRRSRQHLRLGEHHL